MKRTPMIVVGVLLVVLGITALVWQKFSYTQRETLVDVGAVNITADTQKSWRVPPIVGGIALAGGGALILLGARKQ